MQKCRSKCIWEWGGIFLGSISEIKVSTESPKKNILALIEKLASAFPYDDIYREKEHGRGNGK